MGISKLLPNFSDTSSQVSIDLGKTDCIFPVLKKESRILISFGYIFVPLLLHFLPILRISFLLTGFVTLSELGKWRLFQAQPKNTGCCFCTVYKKYMPFFAHLTS
jgi:hypothetical protein